VSASNPQSNLPMPCPLWAPNSQATVAGGHYRIGL
jgi:hypothetical protein